MFRRLWAFPCAGRSVGYKFPDESCEGWISEAQSYRTRRRPLIVVNSWQWTPALSDPYNNGATGTTRDQISDEPAEIDSSSREKGQGNLRWR
jgi:hypothetical protein